MTGELETLPAAFVAENLFWQKVRVPCLIDTERNLWSVRRWGGKGDLGEVVSCGPCKFPQGYRERSLPAIPLSTPRTSLKESLSGGILLFLSC